ncbi:MAG: hypothetical protein ACFB0D_00920 [Phormidesmis sp.]
MDVSLLRQLWSIVESAPSHRVSSLDDSGVVQWLMDLLKADPTFDSRQLPVASRYIQSRLPLIRDLAQQL